MDHRWAGGWLALKAYANERRAMNHYTTRFLMLSAKTRVGAATFHCKGASRSFQ